MFKRLTGAIFIVASLLFSSGAFAQKIFTLSERAVNKGSNEAALELSRLAAKNGGTYEGRSTLEWVELAAKRGSKKAIRQLITTHAASGNDRDAMSWVEARYGARGKYTGYMNIARDFSRSGGDLPQNSAAAARWFNYALDINSMRAAREVRTFFARATPAQKREIMRELRGVALRSKPEVALSIAKLVAGQGESYKDEAMEFYIIAMRRGSPLGLSILLQTVSADEEGDKSSKRILKVIEDLANKGSTNAMLALAEGYALGTIAEMDPVQSLKWYKRAADAGVSEAQYQMGIRLKDGTGVPQNLGEAKALLQAAARQGHEPSIALLAKLEAPAE